MSGKLRNFVLSDTGIWLVCISWVLFVSNLWLPRNWGFYGTDDWDLTYSTFEVARQSIVEYGQWPSYNPYMAMGSDLNANPQATHASIFFIPVLLFGTFYGYKVAILMAMLIGCRGAFRLFEHIGGDRLTALCLSLIFCGCAYFSRHIFQAGHSNTLYFYLLPWLFFFLNRFRTSYKITNFIMPALILCQMIIGGAPFVFISSVLLLAVWCIGLLWIEQSPWKPVVFMMSAVLLAIGISAWKVWPVLQFWRDMPRLVNDESGINLLIWLQALCDLETDTRTAHAWHEFAMGFSLILVALTIYNFRNINNYKKWLLLFGLIVWFGLGNMPAYINPWYVLNHYVPFFTSLRAPYRFGILTVFILSLAYLQSINNSKDKSLMYIILIAITCIQTLSFNSISKKLIGSQRIDEITMPVPTQLPEPQRKNQDNKYQFLLVKNNYAVPNAYEPLFLQTVSDTLAGFIDGGTVRKFTPQQIDMSGAGQDILLNLRYSPFWTLSGNGKLGSRNGLLYVHDAQGPITLTYKNPDLTKGIITSICSLILLFLSAYLISRQQKHILNP
jgi:hypothetical protein